MERAKQSGRQNELGVQAGLTPVARAWQSCAVSLTRRRLIGTAVALAVASPWRQAFAQSDLGLREWIRAGVERDASGSVFTVFGLQADLAREVLLPATRADVLPDGYVPADLQSV